MGRSRISAAWFYSTENVIMMKKLTLCHKFVATFLSHKMFRINTEDQKELSLPSIFNISNKHRSRIGAALDLGPSKKVKNRISPSALNRTFTVSMEQLNCHRVTKLTRWTT